MKYDLLSTVIHTPQEADTALDLYEGSMNSSIYKTYGYYGRPDFLVLGKRLGLVEQRAITILDNFSHKQQQVIALVEKSQLSPNSRNKYANNLEDKLKRITIIEHHSRRISTCIFRYLLEKQRQQMQFDTILILKKNLSSSKAKIAVILIGKGSYFSFCF